MQMRFTQSSNQKEMVEAAKEFGLRYVGVSKADLAKALNEKLDEIEIEQNTVKLNLAEAEDILTPTEMVILSSLLTKIDEAKFNVEMDAKMNELVEKIFPGMKKAKIQGSTNMPLHIYGDLPSFFYGQPGTSKSVNIEEFAKKHGINFKF